MKIFKAFILTLLIPFSVLAKNSNNNIELTTVFGDKLPKEFMDIQNKRADKLDTRYSKIAAPLDVAKDNIDFWSRQLSEHALFLHLGIEDKALKERGLELHNKFEEFRKTLNQDLTIEQLEKILPLVKELREYKIEILTTLLDGKWIGWIFPLFARHIILELDYFLDKLQNIPYSERDEIAFWNIINDEHAGFAAHLLDPSETKLSDLATKMSKQFAKIVKSEDEMMLQISLRNANELDKYNRTADKGIDGNKVKSVISPTLIKHVVREGQRSIETLNKLKDKTGAIYPKKEILVD